MVLRKDAAMSVMTDTEFQEHQRILGEAYHGRLNPDQAEAEAKRLNLRPFASKPDPLLLDPMLEAVWSLSMSVAWMCWRTSEKVRESWPEYCREWWQWNSHHSRLPVENEGHVVEVTGWEISQRQVENLSTMGIAEALSDDSDEVGKAISVKSAREWLWRHLANGEFTAYAIKVSEGSLPQVIPAHEWPYLNHVADRDLNDELRLNNNMLRAEYRDVKLRRDEIVRYWPPQAEGEKAPSTGRQGGRPNKQERVKEIYLREYPNGHGHLTWKHVCLQISEEFGEDVSVKTIQRAVASRD